MATQVTSRDSSIIRTTAMDLPSPVLRRENITWTGGIGGRPLTIDLLFENPQGLPSRRVAAHVEVAPFGAFLPWKPLAVVQVPPVPPGGRVRVATSGGEASLPLPPSAGLDALPAPEGLRAPEMLRAPEGGTPFAGRIQQGFLAFASGFLGATHFVGNLNVFVSRSHPVERHVQHAVGLRPGRQNFALFQVGDGRRDRYLFSVGAGDARWELKIPGVAWDEPVEIEKAVLVLCIQPPARAESGEVSVLVRRASTGQRVPVEFRLEATAGTRCYSFPG